MKMETIKFKTNIKCSGCVATVTPFLNEAVGEKNWKVDFNNPIKLLTVESEKNEAVKVIQALNKAGYKAEVISEN
jgi:copper chaperone